MKATIRLKRGGTEYRGRSPESIARRVWGRRVRVEDIGPVSPGSPARFARITRPAGLGDPSARHLLAEVVVYLDGPTR